MPLLLSANTRTMLCLALDVSQMYHAALDIGMRIKKRVPVGAASSTKIESPLVQRKGRSGMVADIQKAVKERQLKPGDRLLSIQEMCAHYGLSHRTVTLAMAELKRAGVIVSQPRRGYYVAEATPAVLPENTQAAHRYHQLFSSPASISTVTMYVSEVYPDNIAAWRAAFLAFEQEFPRIRVDPLFMDRHDLREIDHRHVDLVHSTPVALALFKDRWVPFTDPDEAGYTADVLLAPFHDRLAIEGQLMGVPFGASTRYLYVNQAMLRRIRRDPAPCRDICEVLDLAAEFERTVGRPGEYGMRIDNLFLALELGGAIRMTAPGRCMLDEGRTSEIARRYAALSCPSDPDQPNTAFVEDFRQGRTMFYWHGSYLIPLFEAQPDLEWSACIEPEAPGSSKEFWWLMLAIDRQSDRQAEARELMRFLCREEVMSGLVRPPALFPARQRLIDQQKPNPRVAPGTAAEAVRRCNGFWPVDEPTVEAIKQAGSGLLRKEFDLPELIRQMKALRLI
jgi:DNA-binding transcriptional regulator YhcF (GntR family)